MNRGQAFDTMMLVISVIVAVAILGILMGFLGGIGGFGKNAKTVFPDLMKKVQNRGYGLEIEKSAEFTPEGDRIIKKDVIGETPIGPNDLVFDCITLCDPNGPLEKSTLSGGEETIFVKKKYSATVAVCFAGGTGGDNKYHAVIVPKEQSAKITTDTPCRNI